MSQVCKSLPRSYKLKQCIKELISRWDTQPTPHGIVGFQQSLEDRLCIRVQQLLKSLEHDAKLSDHVLRVKLSVVTTLCALWKHLTERLPVLQMCVSHHTLVEGGKDKTERSW